MAVRVPVNLEYQEQPVRVDNHRALADHADEMVRLSMWLTPEECAFVHLRYKEGLTTASLAKMYKQTQVRIRQELAMLERRMKAPSFSFLILYARCFELHPLAVARKVHHQGYTVREAAKVMGVSFHEARDAMRRVEHAMEFEARRRSFLR